MEVVYQGMKQLINEGGDLMELVLHRETKQFIYESREERDEHVELMIKDGWGETGKIKRLKLGVSVWDARNNPDNYEWFAEFYKFGEGLIYK